MKRRSRGFTLVEVLVIVIAVAILASIAVVSFVAVQQRSRDDARKAQAAALMSALQNYYNENGEYPAACASDNTSCDVDRLASALVPTYLGTISSDPANKPMQYIRGTFPNKSFGLRIMYEAAPVCKTGQSWQGNLTYAAASNTWWGAIPACTTPAPFSG